MSISVHIPSGRALPVLAVLCCLALEFALVPAAIGGPKHAADQVQTPLDAFQPGETLIYEVSWSKIVTAGTAVMQVVRAETQPDGKKVLALILTGRSTGLLDKFFPVRDQVRSVFDPLTMQSLSYGIAESFGKKRRQRTLVFDHKQKTVVFTQNDEPPQTLVVPDGVQDALSSLYYLRMRKDFTPGKPIVIEVHDSGKNWSIEVHTIGREKVKTPAGEFSAIKVRTRPLSEGVFLGKGEAFLWLTDDARKVPVLMKSTIKIGSFVFTLKDMKPGGALYIEAR